MLNRLPVTNLQDCSLPEIKLPVAVLECFTCGRTYCRGDGRFCSPRCQAAFDAGLPAFNHYATSYSLPILGNGFAVACAGCGETFSSRGLKFCSAECARSKRSAAKTVELGGLGRTCPCGAEIPRFERTGKARRAVRDDAAFCSDKCRKKWKRQNREFVRDKLGMEESARTGNLSAISASNPLISHDLKNGFLRPSTADSGPAEPGRRVGSLRVWGPSLSAVEIRCAQGAPAASTRTRP